jgi:hypothetical protein
MALGRRKKAATAAPAKKAGPSRKEKLAQIKLAFSMTRKSDPKMLPLVLGAFVLTLAVFVLIGTVTVLIPFIVLGVMVALLVGAAAAVLSNLRGNWRVTPAVGFTKEQDLLHMVIGRPGIVLVGEGNPNRVRNLIGTQKRALSRIIGDTPVYDVTVGDGEGQVALKDLEKHFLRLPRNIKPAQVNALDARLKAMRTNTALPVPKGPMPTRVPRGRAR